MEVLYMMETRVVSRVKMCACNQFHSTAEKHTFISGAHWTRPHSVSTARCWAFWPQQEGPTWPWEEAWQGLRGWLSQWGKVTILPKCEAVLIKKMKKTLPGSVHSSQDRVLCPVPLNGHTLPGTELTSRIFAELTNASILQTLSLKSVFWRNRRREEEIPSGGPTSSPLGSPVASTCPHCHSAPLQGDFIEYGSHFLLIYVPPP